MDLEVVSLAHDPEEETAHLDRLRRLFPIQATAVRTNPLKNYLRGVAALPGSRPLTHCLLDAPGMSTLLHQIARDRPPDVVLAYCSGMARFALEPPLDRYPMVLDYVDVDSEKWAALGRATRGPMGWIYRREAKCLGQFEADAAHRAIASIVVNARERDALLRVAPDAIVHVVGLGVDVEHLRAPSPPADTPRVIFCGVMNYKPNVDGVRWFAREVWPLVAAQRPDARFVVVGSDPTESIRRLASTSIEVTGTVPDVREYLWGAAVSVAPLLTARGLQNKVLEAIAAGLPAVVTETVFHGLPPEAHPACRSASTPDAFADSVLSLLAHTGAARRAVAAEARFNVLSWDEQLAPL